MMHELVAQSTADSPVHRLSPGVKLGVTFTILVGVALIPRSWALSPLVGIAVALLAIAAVARVRTRVVARRVLLLAPFIAGVAVLALFQPNGLAAAAFLASKSAICLFAMILLTETTSFTKTLEVLRRIHVPVLLITVIALMYRYLFVLVDEAQRMRRARRARTFTRRRRAAWRSAASVAGQLFVRSSERADRVYAAMSARGWR